MNKQCEGCVYSKLISAGNPAGGTCCHYLLETGRRREADKSGNCLSHVQITAKDKAKKKKKEEGWGWFG